jgi:HlyD family secretion protein
MKKALPILVVLAIVIGGGFWYSRTVKAAPAAGETTYKVAKVETGTVKKTVSSTGVIKPWTTVDIKSRAGGRVEKLMVDIGSVVKKGDIICTIDRLDTQLRYNTASADVEDAKSRESQNEKTYGLTVAQTRIAVQTAEAQLNSTKASRDAAKVRLENAKTLATAQPKLTEAAIKSAEANYRNALKQRQQLDATQPQDRAVAQAAYDQAVANKTNAELNLSRQKTLLEKGFVSEQVVDTARANYEVTVAQVNSAKQRLNNIAAEQKAAVESAEARVAQALAQWENAKAGAVDIDNRKAAVSEAQATLAQWEAQVKQSEAALAQARSNLVNAEIRKLDIATARASMARAQANIINAKTTLDETVVRAPRDGVVTQRFVEEGTMITSGTSLVSAGANIVTIADVSKLYLEVNVDETDIANVQDGQTVDVLVEAFQGIPFEGKVSRIDPQALVEQNVTTVHVRVELDNSVTSFRLLKPGMNATCEFVVDKKEDVVSVPNESLRTDDNGKYVEIASGGKPAPPDPKTGAPADAGALIQVKSTKRRVEVGLEGNETTEITSGLKAGETIITQKIEPAPPTSGSPFGGGGGRMGGFGGGRR